MNLSIYREFEGVKISSQETEAGVSIWYDGIRKIIILKRNKNTGCLECISHRLDNYGYAGIGLKRKMVKLHRLTYCLFNNLDLKDIQGWIICHKCDNRKCCNPEHLMKGTHIDNMYEMRVRERVARGEDNGNAKLSEFTVKMIREDESEFEWDSLYHVSKNTINRIKRGETWKGVK